MIITDIWHMCRRRPYRRYFGLLVASGYTSSIIATLTSIYAVKVIGLTSAQVGALWMSGVIGSLISLAIGAASDRMPGVSYVRWISAWLGLGSAILLFVHTFIAAVAIFGFFLSATSALNSQIFAELSGAMKERKEASSSLVSGTLRAGYSLGYIIGPPTGALLVTALSYRSAFLIVAICYFAIAVTSWRTGRSRTGRKKPAGREKRPSTARANFTLIFFCAIVSLALIGDFMKDSYLSLYVINVLRRPLITYSLALTVCASLELIVFPIAGRLADQRGKEPVIAVALALSFADYAVLVIWPSIWMVYISQILHVFVIAVMYGICINYAQDLVADRVGVASAAFFSAVSMAKVGSGLVGALLVSRLGIRNIFWIPAAMSVISLALFIPFLLPLSGWSRADAHVGSDAG